MSWLHARWLQSFRGTPPLGPQILGAAGGAANVAATFLYGVNATVVGGALTAWADANGGTPTISQSTASKQPIDSGSDYVFDGVDDLLTGAFTLAQPITLFLVVNQITWTSGRYIADGGTLNRMAVIQRTVTPGLQQFDGSFGAATSNGTPGVYAVISSIWSGASSDIQVNNGTVGTGNPGVNAAAGLTLANAQNGSVAGNLAIKAAVLMNVAASASQRAAVKALLYSAYGITP